MRDRLTLKAETRRAADQATDRQHLTSQAPGKRQPQELQSVFLTDRLDRIVTVYLVSGIKLSGKVRQFDQYTLLLQGADGLDSLTFKRATSTVASLASASLVRVGSIRTWI